MAPRSPGLPGLGYVVAFGVTLTVVAIRLTLNKVSSDHSMFLPFVGAVMLAAWWGGLKPGLLTTILSCLAVTFFVIQPDEQRNRDSAVWVPLVVFLIVGLMVSWLCETLHATQRRSEARQQLLEREIEARQKAEETVRTSQSLLQAILDHSSAIIFVKSPEGRYLLVNKEFCNVLHLTQDQVLGRTVFDLFPPPIAQQFYANDRQVIDTRQTIVREEVLPIEDKTLTYLSVKFPLFTPSGEPYAMGGVATNITERIKAEEELRVADRRKDEFLATLSHELRNPLAPILNALQVLFLAEHDKRMRDQARTVMERQLQQMVRLIDDLLDLSRISRNRLEIRKEVVELGTILENAVETSRPLVESFNHELTVTLPGEPLYLEADASRLGQVFANLLNNAAKYTERGGHIWLTAERQDQEAVVTIRDNGIGILPEMLPRIFDMFMQINQSLERSQGGLGIGLTLVKRLVEMHEGTVEVHSDGPGLGSQFRVRLPLVTRSSPEKHEETFGAVASPPSSSRRILVVDDNEDSAESLAMMLRIMGHHVVAAYNGLEALEIARTTRPEVIFLDLGMPNISGYELARRLRQQPWGQDMILVALTGWGQEEDRRRTQEAGFHQHLVKPADPAILTQMLAQLPAGQDPHPKNGSSCRS
jgi:PAS domain S-box-containing protein